MKKRGAYGSLQEAVRAAAPGVLTLLGAHMVGGVRGQLAARLPYGFALSVFNLLQRAEPDFDVAIEGSTIRLKHNGTGSVFEYLWFKDAPHLRNATVRPALSADTVPGRLAATAERTALHQLNAANLVEAA